MSRKFRYGDLWPAFDIEPSGKHGIEEVDIGRYLHEDAYTNFVHRIGYHVYLDYDMPGLASTYYNQNRIVVNGNCTEHVISALMKHELGHLMLFSGNGFDTTSRSIKSEVSKRLYTARNIRKYGMDQLFRAENVVQDIIIETTSNEDCVCNAMYEDYSERSGVRHLTNLEDIRIIVNEVCMKLVPIDEYRKTARNIDTGQLLKAMNRLKQDLDESIEQKRMRKKTLEATGEGSVSRETKKKQNEYDAIANAINRTYKQFEKCRNMRAKHEQQIDKINEKINNTEDRIEKAESLGKSTKALEHRLRILEAKRDNTTFDETMNRNEATLNDIMDKLNSERDRILNELHAIDQKKEIAESNRKHIESTQKAIDRQTELEDLIQSQIDSVGGLAGPDRNADDHAQSNDNEDESDDGHNGGDSAGHDEHGETTNSSGGTATALPDDRSWSTNLTDHLLDEDGSSGGAGGGHSWDVGYPPSSLIKLKTIRTIRNMDMQVLVSIKTEKSLRPTYVHQDTMNNPIPGGMKRPEYESTYFKSNKRELKPTDMLKGRRKKRYTGINVLLGLDVSKSMTDAWRNQYQQVFDIISKLRKKVEINDVVCFTYNTKVGKIADSPEGLKPKADGGNAFGYVYKQIFTKLPMRLRNEIILVTDCGDNLGFTLDDNCLGDINGEKITNHISIIDTDKTLFYAKMKEFDDNDWSIHSIAEDNLEETFADEMNKIMYQ